MDEAEARLGTRLGNYALLAVVGRGGMGVVYEGQHIYIRRKVAVKVMYRHLFTDPSARQRFLHEAQAASLIEHPNVVGVSDFGEAPDGTVFLVMSYVDGEQMEQVLRRERVLPLFRTLVILEQVARALGAAHARNVVHRDLKPENIMLRQRPGRREIVRTVEDQRGAIDYVEPEGSFDFVTVLDFGAAVIRDARDALGDNGTVIATPYYMAPETAHHGEADARSDIYALGVIFYRALTGKLPIEGRDAHEIMTRQVYDPVIPPRLRNPNVEISEHAERVIMKALEKEPRLRHQTMEEFYADLQRGYGRVRFRRVNNRPQDELLLEHERTPRPIPLLRPKRRSDAPTMTTPLPVTRTPILGTPMPAPTASRSPVSSPPTPTLASSAQKARARMLTPGGSPLLLTRKKGDQSGATAHTPRPEAPRPADRHPTLPLGARTPTPAAEVVAQMEPDRHRTWPYAPTAAADATPGPDDT